MTSWRRGGQAYLAHPLDLPAQRYPEISVTAPFAGYRLMAKFDLVAASPGERLVLVDWKTNEGRRPRREWLAERMQTRVYRYMLVAAGQRFNAGPSRRAGARGDDLLVRELSGAAGAAAIQRRRPAERPDRVGGFGARSIDSAVAGADGTELARAGDERVCQYCRYASFCERGRRGQLDR